MGPRSSIVSFGLVLAIGCGGGEASPPSAPPAEPTATAPAAASPEAPAAAVPTTPAPAPEVAAPAPVPAVPDVDLLHAVRTEISASSAFHDDLEQVGRIADGDPATAWNSRTGDLVGAWVEVRIPEGASVRSIEMTAGFTREGGREDLFTGNHRISRVRVSLDGTALGEHALDVESRALQSLPVTGGAGVYRIEVIGDLPGSHASWGETCISELRILGQPGTAPVGTVPSTSLGGLGAAAVGDEAPLTAEEEAEEAAFDAESADFEAVSELSTAVYQWSSYDSTLYSDSTRPPGIPAPTLSHPPPTRAEAFGALIAFVEPRAPSEAAALRTLVSPRAFDWEGNQSDLEAIVRALDAATAAGGPRLRCEWRAMRFDLWFDRIEILASDITMRLDLRAIDAESGEPDEGGHTATRAEARSMRSDADHAQAFSDWIEELMAGNDGSETARRTTARRLSSRTPPASLTLGARWDALLASATAVLEGGCPLDDEDGGDEGSEDGDEETLEDSADDYD